MLTIPENPAERSQFYESCVIGGVVGAGLIIALRGALEDKTKDDIESVKVQKGPSGKGKKSYSSSVGKARLSC